MALDLNTFWDFGRPDISEQRFRAALLMSTGDEALILRTQIARTYGLRKDFDGARRLLSEIEGSIPSAGPEVLAGRRPLPLPHRTTVGFTSGLAGDSIESRRSRNQGVRPRH